MHVMPLAATSPSEAQRLRYKVEFLESVRQYEQAELAKASASLDENLGQVQLSSGRLQSQADGIQRLSRVRRALPYLGMASGMVLLATASTNPAVGLAAGLVCLACVGGIEATDRKFFPEKNHEFWAEKRRFEDLMASNRELLAKVQGSGAQIQNLQGQINGARGQLDLALRSTRAAEQAVAEVERLANAFKGGADLVKEEKGRVIVGGVPVRRRAQEPL